MSAVTDDDPIPAPPLPPPESHFEETVRQHPMAAVVISVLVGFLIAKMAL
jgi:hypothetical protein